LTFILKRIMGLSHNGIARETFKRIQRCNDPLTGIF